MQLNDYQNYLALKGMLNSADFKVKGDAVKMMASVFKWFDSQEEKYKPKEEKKK